MDYQILYHPLVADDIRKIPHNIKERIRIAIENRILKEPYLTGKPLRKSLKGHRKMRVGDYRIIYRIGHETVIVLKIGHRKEVYLTFLRKMQHETNS